MDKQPKTKLSPLTEETRPARVLVLSYPVFILSLSLALVVGILAGSFLSQHMAPAPAQNVVHQSQPQTQAQPQARQEQPQISRETQQHIAELERGLPVDHFSDYVSEALSILKAEGYDRAISYETEDGDKKKALHLLQYFFR